jgi:hypothetical protein
VFFAQETFLLSMWDPRGKNGKLLKLPKKLAGRFPRGTFKGTAFQQNAPKSLQQEITWCKLTLYF